MKLYRMPSGVRSHWASFENQTAARNRGGIDNRGSKGHAFESISAGETKTLLDFRGSGLINRIWLTVTDRSPENLRSLRLDMYWDGADKPAVSCPLGDFFGIGLGRRIRFECALFSDPEGRSFNCLIPMPFRKSARVTVTNESGHVLPHIFYDINFVDGIEHGQDTLYFHAHWRRESPNALGRDYEILPEVSGRGRFLGCNVGIITNPAYRAWWGEGEFKIWFGDDRYPTLCGTGAEDYVGSAWGLGSFYNRLQGCPVADGEKGQWCFYRYHLDDPVYFDDSCRVAVQTIGGTYKQTVAEMIDEGLPLTPVSIDVIGGDHAFIRLMEMPQPVDLKNPALPDGWVNFWRQDDWSSTAYFYLDSPESNLPELAPVAFRTAGLGEKDENSTKRMDG